MTNLEKYKLCIWACKKTAYFKCRTHRHHIRPKCLYPQLADDSRNIVIAPEIAHWALHEWLLDHYVSLEDKEAVQKLEHVDLETFINGGRKERGGRGHGKRNSEEAKPREEIEIPAYEPSKPKPERVVVPKSEEEVAEMKKTAMDFLTNIFRCMETEVSITMDYDEKEGCLNATFDGDDMGILIGKRGQTLDSLQYLTSLVINKNHSDYTRVKLDTEDYRRRRADTLENLSRNIAYKVKRTHKAIALEPMNPYERRIIHSSLQSNRYVETYSEGEEPYRHVVVTPKKS